MDTHDVIYGLTPFEYEGYDTDWLGAVTAKPDTSRTIHWLLMGEAKTLLIQPM